MARVQSKVASLGRRTGSSETSVLTTATRLNNPEDAILHSDRRENFKSYISGIIGATIRRPKIKDIVRNSISSFGRSTNQTNHL
jgi:hypothetical protein